MKEFKTHYDILPPGQKIVWPHLGKIADLGFVLYGGTAISLQCGHRESIDFDFFSNLIYSKKEIFSVLPFLRGQPILQDKKGTFTVSCQVPNANPVKISFFSGIRFGRVGDPIKTDDGNLWLASKEDLLSLKLALVLKRCETKDYRDIAELLRNGQKLENGILGAQKLYGDSFIPSIALTALLYFKDLKPALNKKDQSTIIGAVRKLNEKNLTKDGWMPWKSHFLCDKSISNRLDEDKKASFLSGLLRQEYKTKAETILNGNNPFGSRNLGEAKVVLYEKLLDMQDKNILPKQVDKGIER